MALARFQTSRPTTAALSWRSAAVGQGRDLPPVPLLLEVLHEGREFDLLRAVELFDDVHQQGLEVELRRRGRGGLGGAGAGPLEKVRQKVN